MAHPLSYIKDSLANVVPYDTVVIRNFLMDEMKAKFEKVFLFKNRFMICINPIDTNTQKSLVMLYVYKNPDIGKIREFVDETMEQTKDMALGNYERIFVSKWPSESVMRYMSIRYVDGIFWDGKCWHGELLKR